MERTEVLERLAPIMNTDVRVVEHNPRTRVTVTPDMITLRPGGGARILEMTKEGAKSMAQFCGLPETVIKGLTPETFGLASTELLSHKERYGVIVKDNAITHFTRPGDYHSVNPERALRAVESAIPHIDFHRVSVLPDFAASLEVVGERRLPVRKGDLVQAGANITFSPIGTIDPMVQSYVLRLACTNGMVSNTILREFRFGDGGGGGEGDDIWQWFREATKDAYNGLEAIVNRYQQMINDRIPADQRALVLEQILKEAHLGTSDTNAVRALALENPPQNAYDVMNLLTYASSHIVERPDAVRRTQLAVAGFTNEDTHRSLCPVCHTRRN